MSATLSPGGPSADLSRLDDLALVALAATTPDSPAERALLLRHHDWVARRVRWLARKNGLAAADAEDAVQDSYFALRKAVGRFEPCAGCTFRTFLKRVVTDRFRDFARALKRRARAAEAPAGTAPGARPAVDPPDHRPASNPAAAAEGKELVGRLRAAAQQLAESDQALVAMCLDGLPLRDIAQRLGVSYDAAKHRRRALHRDLARRLQPASR